MRSVNRKREFVRSLVPEAGGGVGGTYQVTLMSQHLIKTHRRVGEAAEKNYANQLQTAKNATTKNKTCTS